MPCDSFPSPYRKQKAFLVVGNTTNYNGELLRNWHGSGKPNLMQKTPFINQPI